MIYPGTPKTELEPQTATFAWAIPLSDAQEFVDILTGIFPTVGVTISGVDFDVKVSFTGSVNNIVAITKYTIQNSPY